MPLQPPTNRATRWCALLLPLTVALLAPACLVDLDNRCGEHQRYDADLASCVCSGDFALVGTTCVACGDNEMGSPDGCVCVEGFSRATASAACSPLSGLGQDCESDADCGDTDYGLCHLEGGATTGYCTRPACSTGEDCPTDYGCNTRESPTFCERPPEGLGEACSSSAECEGYAAGYCETVQAHACLVNDCKADPNKCHGDWVCCDIGLLSQSLCLPPTELEDGNCPVGGTLIPREE